MRRILVGALLWSATTLATDVLKTDGFSSCSNNSDIQVKRMDITYDKGSRKVNFDVAGISGKEQKVMAALVISAFGKQVYEKDFDPCKEKIKQLCPLPKGNFSAQGTQTIPEEFVSKIPAIAFALPNLEGLARLELRSSETNETIACIESTVDNGKSVQIPAVSYAAAGMAGAALLLTALSALGAAGTPGAATPSPSFGDVVGWFQSMAMNGMLSVQYPSVYRSFSSNFAFSGLLVPWEGMQRSIDSFRKSTGGNLTDDSVDFLKHATLVYQGTNDKINKRWLESAMLLARDSVSAGGVNASTGANANTTDSGDNKVMHLVHGIQGYVEELTIPKSNTFMTVLLYFSILLASIIVGILLFKVILEAWALFGNFPKRLTTFRKHYWWTMAKAITNLILLLYGVWTLYCVYQFTNGDSWAVKALAGVTLGMFTLILGYFTFRIWQGVRKFKNAEGTNQSMYEDKEFWRKYSIFYGDYKKSYWWIFIPAIIYMFAKGCVIAGADGHGLVQTAGQLIIESIMLTLLLWSRPFSLKSSNWINIIIQVVRVLSVVCILIFVEELGISQTTKSVTGVVLIIVQSVLTGVLALLIAINAIIVCCKQNPHRKRRKELEKAKDHDNLTPLDARNSLLLPSEYKGAYDIPPVSKRVSLVAATNPFISRRREDDGSRDHLLTDGASSMGTNFSRTHTRDRSASPDLGERMPTLPQMEMRYGRRY